MRIHLYAVCWNERLILPYFLRHYEQFCEKIIIYDNGSDDGSQDLIKAHPAGELRTVDSRGEFREDTVTLCKETKWKECSDKPDWVIACDIDEFLYHPRLLEFLAECREQSVTIPVPSGWQLVSEAFPEGSGQIYDEVRTGTPDRLYGKWVIFDPAAITAMNYNPGCHMAVPDGRVEKRNDPALKLLHAKYLGLDYLSSRYRALAARVGHFNRSRGFTGQYDWSDERLAAAFAHSLKSARSVPLGDT